MQANIDSLEVSLFEQFNVEVDAKVSGNQQKCQTTMEDAGEEEPIEEYDVSYAEANVDAPADALEFAEEEPMEEFRDWLCKRLLWMHQLMLWKLLEKKNPWKNMVVVLRLTWMRRLTVWEVPEESMENMMFVLRLTWMPLMFLKLIMLRL
ncbi:hypothetical protein HAX54_034592 [Datura stramonium]|uniref:Uncharacterized protein n=1 Tax=Datura stramonium TaxID=4076 RepID=A0ABS8VFP4_DATST|nr:hypothetical protein [Datura stramonium]